MPDRQHHGNIWFKRILNKNNKKFKGKVLKPKMAFNFKDIVLKAQQ